MNHVDVGSSSSRNASARAAAKIGVLPSHATQDRNVNALEVALQVAGVVVVEKWMLSQGHRSIEWWIQFLARFGVRDTRRIRAVDGRMGIVDLTDAESPSIASLL